MACVTGDGDRVLVRAHQSVSQHVEQVDLPAAIVDDKGQLTDLPARGVEKALRVRRTGAQHARADHDPQTSALRLRSNDHNAKGAPKSAVHFVDAPADGIDVLDVDRFFHAI